MTTPLDHATTALETHPAIDQSHSAYTVTTTPFDTTITVDSHTNQLTYTVTVIVPTLDAVVDGETVAPVVQTGWYETLERRLEDVNAATRTPTDTLTVTLDDTTDTIEITIQFTTTNPNHGADDAKTIVDYVEGTYLEGVIPGYDYTDPVATILNRAKNRSTPTDP